MKRSLISFCLLCCLILNQVGFFLFFQIQSIKNEWFWELNKFSAREDLDEVEVQVPVVFPYAYYQNDFETTNTSIQYEGEYYRITKHKYDNDTLYLVFVRDSTKNKINALVQNWVGSSEEERGPISSKQRSPLSKLVEEHYLGFRIAVSIKMSKYNFKTNMSGPLQLYPQFMPRITSPPPEIRFS